MRGVASGMKLRQPLVSTQLRFPKPAGAARSELYYDPVLSLGGVADAEGAGEDWALVGALLAVGTLVGLGAGLFIVRRRRRERLEQSAGYSSALDTA